MFVGVFPGRLVDDVDPPVYIVAFRKVCPAMSAAALLAPKRRACDEPRDRHQIPVSPAVGWGRGGGGRRRDVEARDRLFKIGSDPEQADRSPHQIANLVARQR